MRDCLYSAKIGPNYSCQVTKEECIRETGKLCPWLLIQQRAKYENNNNKKQDHEVSNGELANRLVLLEKMASLPTYIDSAKTAILRQETSESIYKYVDRVKNVIDSAHDVSIILRYEEIKASTIKTETT